MNPRALFVLVIIVMVLSADPAFAARTAMVDSDSGGELLKTPDKTSEVILKVKKGQKLTASNYPTAGYFKVRMPDGTLGWMRSDILELGPMPDLTHPATPQPE